MTQSCKDDGLVKLDIIISEKQFCEGENLPKGCIRKTLPVNFQSRYKETDSVSFGIFQLSAKIEGNSTVYWQFREKL